MAKTLRGRSTWDATEFQENKFFAGMNGLSDMDAENKVGLGTRIVTKLKLDSDAQMLINLAGLRTFFVPFGGPNGSPIWAVHKGDRRSATDFMPEARLFAMSLTATYAQWLSALGAYLDSRPFTTTEEDLVAHRP